MRHSDNSSLFPFFSKGLAPRPSLQINPILLFCVCVSVFFFYYYLSNTLFFKGYSFSSLFILPLLLRLFQSICYFLVYFLANTVVFKSLSTSDRRVTLVSLFGRDTFCVRGPVIGARYIHHRRFVWTQATEPLHQPGRRLFLLGTFMPVFSFSNEIFSSEEIYL